jgi:C4-dicarboxylate transporter, DctM subunit
MLTILIILLVLMFISGAPLFAVMFACTALGALFSMRGYDTNVVGAINKMFRISSRDEISVLSTIPMFIGAGYILAESKTADRLVRFANAALGYMPGGLAIVTILTCALFTVFTGASGVTIIALGGVLLPALVRQGYPKKFSMGLIAGTGSVGLLFPPALPLFIFGTVYGLTSLKDLENKPWSTEKFLAAGIFPGMLLIAMLGAVAMFVAVRKKLPRQPFAIGEFGDSLVRALPELFIPFGVILGLANGFGLPEIAALTMVYVIVLELGIYRAVTPRQLWGISREALAMIGAIFAIIFASTAFTDFMVNAQVPQKLVTWTQDHVDSKVVFLLAINVILLIVGTVMDIFSAIVVVLPLIASIARSYGIDPYHLGVIFLLNLEVGYLHPPVGLNLFLTSVKFQRPITEVMWATVPFLITMILALFVVTYVPALTSSSVRFGQLIGMSPMEHEPVKNLLKYAHDGVAESTVKVKQLTFVDAAGKPLLAGGKPVVKEFARCRSDLAQQQKAAAEAALKSGAEAPSLTDEQVERIIDSCQKPFFAVTECAAGDAACANKAIAKWVVETYNEDHPAEAIIVVDSVTFAEGEEPLTLEEEVKNPDGTTKRDPLDNAVTESIPLKGPDGKPLVRTLAWCDQLEFKSDTEKCRNLFITVSGCHINFDVPADAEAVTSCAVEATKEWIKDNASIAKNPKLKGAGGRASSEAAAEEGGGCSAGGGAGMLVVGGVLLALRQRRRRTRAA